MSNFSIPATGIQTKHEPVSGDSPQIIRLNLTEKDAHVFLQYARNGGRCSLKTGQRPQVTFGTKHVSLQHGTDKFPQEVFSGPLDGSQPVYFSGKLDHTLEVQQAKEATARVDQALASLKNNLKQSQEERATGESSLVNNRLMKSQHRPSPLGGGLLGSRPTSPFLSASFSPRSGPTSAPLLAGQSKQEKIKLEAIKIPVIHLLATGPQEGDKLAKKLRVKRSEIEPVLFKVATDGREGKKQLKDRLFRDLDVWKFPYQFQSDRQSAIDHAVSAFDRQRIDKSDNLWQMLLAKEDRGKGISLSKLNFDKMLTTGNLTPKLPERSTDGSSSQGKSMASSESEKKGKAAAASQADHDGKAGTTEKKPRSNMPKDPLKMMAKVAKDNEKASEKTSEKVSARRKDAKTDLNSKSTGIIRKAYPMKDNVKIKSSERIIDSDEEAATASTITTSTSTKRPDTSRPKPSRVEKTTIASPRSDRPSTSTSSSKPPIHKPHLSGSSGGNSDYDRGRLDPNSAMVRTRGGKDTTGVPASATDTLKASVVSQSRNASRPRTGSSPNKPSPLGSSPPTNSRDADTSSNSSKGTALSSAPSSPPSIEHTQSKKQKSSPAVPEKKLANKPLKRKADTDADQHPAKRQQANGSDTREKFNSLPKALTDEIDRRPKRDSPDSDISSISDKSELTMEGLVQETRRFHKLYASYKTLHEQMNAIDYSQRNDKEVDRLWKQHNRLSEMKAGIWKDWRRLEKMGKA